MKPLEISNFDIISQEAFCRISEYEPSMGFRFEGYNVLQDGKSSNANWRFTCEPETSIPSNLSQYVAYHNMEIPTESELTPSKQPDADIVFNEREHDLSVNIEPHENSLHSSDDCHIRRINPRLIDPFHDDWPHW